MLIIFEPFKRINKFDFDADSTFDSYDAALAYVRNPLSTAYVGQRIFVRSSSIVEGSNNDILGKVYIVKKKYDRNDDGEILHDANGENIIEWYLDEQVTVDNFIEIFNKLPKYSISTNTIHVTKIEGSLDRVLLDIGTGNYNVDGDYVLTLGDDNTHYSNYTSTFGSQNIAGMKAFKIYDHNTSTKTIRLDSVEGIAIGMVYSTRLDGNWFNSGKIVDIDAENNTVTVDAMIDKNVSNASETLGYYLMFVDHPELGTAKIGAYSSARGCQTYAGYQAFAEGYYSKAMGRYSHAEGFNTFSWYAAHSEGNSAKAIGNASHAEGTFTVSHGVSSHAEGHYGAAYGVGAHKEGSSTRVISTDPYQNISWDPEMTIIPREVLVNRDVLLSFWEGSYTGSSDITALMGELVRFFQIAYGTASHAEGKDTLALNTASHAEGTNTVAYGDSAHAEGAAYNSAHTIAKGRASHAEGQGTAAIGEGAHAEGRSTQAKGAVAHAEGMNTVAEGTISHAEGYMTSVSGYVGHVEGIGATTSGEGAHAEGKKSNAQGEGSHAEGIGTTASGVSSHAEGKNSNAYGEGSHAEGRSTQAKGAVAHAEGMNTVAEGNVSHAEGFKTEAGYISHAEGQETSASGSIAHAEGYKSSASSSYAHAEGNGTCAQHEGSHVEGKGTKSSLAYQHIQGMYNAPDTSAAHIVGWGTSDTSRKNIHTLSTEGNAWFAGDVTVGPSKETLVKQSQLDTLLESIEELKAAVEAILNNNIADPDNS